jgi:hypothetical protein
MNNTDPTNKLGVNSRKIAVLGFFKTPVVLFIYSQEEFEDTKGAIRICISKIPKGQSESVYLRYQSGIQNPYI